MCSACKSWHLGVAGPSRGYCEIVRRQKFSSVHAAFHNHFNQERHSTSRETYKAQRSAALAEWKSLMA